MRHITDIGIDLIKRFEGLSLKPYLCPARLWTIGYGHVIREGEGLEQVTENEAEDLLRKDLLASEKSVLRLVDVPLTGGQFDALVSFCFNLGGGALQRSTLRQKLNRCEYDDAADEFPKWCWAGGRRLSGLLRRREAEKELFLSGW